jgi:hypothetical protein
MDTRALEASSAPDVPAWHELTRLIDRRGELANGLGELDTQQRHAVEAATRAGAHVAELERRRLGGDDVTDAQRAKAAKELERARAEADAPWSERRQGARLAVGDTDEAITGFVVENFDELIDGLTAQGEQAARAVDAAAAQLLSAYQEREAIASRMSALSSVIAPPRPGDVAYTRAERVAAEASRLLDEGGERPPTCRDPRVPRHGQAPAHVFGLARGHNIELESAEDLPTSGFDGGARESPPRVESHSEALSRVLRERSADARGWFNA